MSLSGTHKYSCVTCRSRKVKCDKLLAGCSSCTKAGTACHYSARRTRNTDRWQPRTSIQSLLPAAGPNSISESSTGTTDNPNTAILPQSHSEDDEDDRVIPRELRNAAFESKFDRGHSDDGRLFVSEGKSRYVNRRKAGQLSNLERILFAEDHTTDGANRPVNLTVQPEQARATNAPNLILNGSPFGISSAKFDLQSHHPPPEISRALWDLYASNVDILVKVLYKPDVETLLAQVSQNVCSLTASKSALLFAIYLAAVTTMSEKECARLHGDRRYVLLQRYQRALEQSLVQAEWTTTQDLIVLQAVTLFIVITSRNSARSNWMSVGAAMGVAQAMGLHRDGTRFSLTAADVEVRRRVWWTLCTLDNRISDDCGLEVHVPMTMDTQLPLHINDSDLDNAHKHLPAPRNQFSEMTISLAKMEMAEFGLQLKMSRYRNSLFPVAEMETRLGNKIRHYENTYIPYIKTSLHLQSFCYHGVRLFMAELWKMTHDYCQHNNNEISGAMQEGILRYYTESLQITHLLPARSSQFGWWFRCKYTQWHAMAYLLSELRHHNNGAAVDQALKVLDNVTQDLTDEYRMKDPHDSQAGRSTLCQTLLRMSEQILRTLKQAARQDEVRRNQLMLLETSSFEQGPSNLSERELPIACVTESILPDDSLSEPMEEFGRDISWDQLDTMIETWRSEPYFPGDAVPYEHELDANLDWL